MRMKRFAGFFAAALWLGGEDLFPPVSLAATAAAAPAWTDAGANESFKAIAEKAPRGLYPRYLTGEQSYFTVIGAEDSDREGLLNEDGALEVDKGGFSIEPFLYVRDSLVTWNDVAGTQALELGYLPVPSVIWQWRGITLKTTAFAGGEGEPALWVRYRVENGGQAPEPVRLLLAIRPFQVNPPWQSLNMVGGIAPIHAIGYDGRAVKVDGHYVVPLASPDGFGAVAPGGTALPDHLAKGELPRLAQVVDPSGFASGAMAYDLKLPPGGAREIFLAVPYRDPAAFLRDARVQGGGEAFARDGFRETVAHWEARLARAGLSFPPEAQGLGDAVRSSLAHMFIHRDGPAFYPGSRTYARSWIRDGAGIGSALLGMGYPEEVRSFIRWYAGFQFPDGKIPCCVDSRGADGVPENDSPGEFVFSVAEYYRFTRDLGFAREMWPAVSKAVGYIDALRQQRMTDEYRSVDKRRFFGLMPDSISHEGYAGHPVHAFWDDFWTLRGLKDAVVLAEVLKEDESAARFRRLRDEFRRDLYAALEGTMESHRIPFLPASVELGDFDSTATAMIVNLGGEEANLPRPALTRTLDDYWEYFLKRRGQRIEWDAYTPYEIRMVEAMVRLGRRGQASALLQYLLEGRRPAAWNGWAEMVWRDARAPKFLGDMPHAWIGAEFVRAVRSLFAYERERDGALVLAAGIPSAWLADADGVGVQQLPTWFGKLSYRLRREGPDQLRLSLSGELRGPPGGIVIEPPPDRPLRALTVNGRPSGAFTANEARIGEFPAEVLMTLGPATTPAE